MVSDGGSIQDQRLADSSVELLKTIEAALFNSLFRLPGAS